MTLQGPHQEAEKNGIVNPVHPASLSTGQNAKGLGTSPHANSHLLPSPASTASAETSTISAAFHNVVMHADSANSTGCLLESEPPSARAAVDKDSLSDHDEIDAVLMAHTSSHIRLRWLPGRPPNNVMVRPLSFHRPSPLACCILPPTTTARLRHRPDLSIY